MPATADSDVMAALGAAFAKLGPGVAGAIVSLRFAPEGTTWGDRAASVAGGIASSVYLAPWAVEWLGVASVRVEAGMGFAFGALGLVVLGEATRAVREAQLGQALRGWLRKRAGLSE